MKTEAFEQTGRLARCRSRRPAFTLLELLVVIAIIAILASFLLPALNSARLQARSIQCRERPHQLTLAWLMYADDFNGRVAPNQAGSVNSWVGGIMSFDDSNSDATNSQKLVDPAWSKLGSYIQSAPNFKCPSDPSQIPIYRVPFPRVRSYSMNSAVGFQGAMNDLPFNWGFMSYRKQSDMVRPGPAQLWLVTEEHPDGIDDCVFTVDCSSQFGGARFISVPAHYHYGSANFSFADGHVENHRWVDPNTFVPEKYCGCLAHYAINGDFTQAPNSRDVAWLQAHSSSRLP